MYTHGRLADDRVGYNKKTLCITVAFTTYCVPSAHIQFIYHGQFGGVVWASAVLFCWLVLPTWPLASVAITEQLPMSLLATRMHDAIDSGITTAIYAWSQLTTIQSITSTVPSSPASSVQRPWPWIPGHGYLAPLYCCRNWQWMFGAVYKSSDWLIERLWNNRCCEV